MVRHLKYTESLMDFENGATHVGHITILLHRWRHHLILKQQYDYAHKNQTYERCEMFGVA